MRIVSRRRLNRVWVGLVAVALAAIWLTGCASGNSAPPAETPAAASGPVNGAALYQTRCAECHGPNGEGQPNWRQPGSDGQYPAPPLNGDGFAPTLSDDTLRQIITQGKRTPHSEMPAFAAELTPADTEAVLAFIKTFWAGGDMFAVARLPQQVPPPPPLPSPVATGPLLAPPPASPAAGAATPTARATPVFVPNVSGATATPAAASGSGKTLYTRYCATCHGPNGEGQPNWKQPGPDGLLPAPPHDPTGHTWHHSDKVLLDITANGGVTTKTGMPGFAGQLSADEMAAVLAYIKTFWGPPQIEFQATVTAQDP